MQKKPFSKNNIIVMPTAIQKRINPSIRFISISPFYNICLKGGTMSLGMKGTTFIRNCF